MVTKIDTATITLWNNPVGAVAWYADKGYAAFEFEPSFLKKNLDISPIHMNLDYAKQHSPIFNFPQLNHDTFYGLPGLLADALPDKFGHAMIDAWIARQGKDPANFNPIERLCHLGKRGMGALEFHPSNTSHLNKITPVEIAELAQLANKIIAERSELNVTITDSDTMNQEALLDILRVGTSAGGARPKAIIAMNDDGHILSGQTNAPQEYQHWIVKFDGVTDLELAESSGFGRIEYAYFLMAKKAKINMMPSRLLTENGRAHFLTKRFDRLMNTKIHMQTLCGLAHYDYNMAGAYSYEQAFMIMRKMKMSKAEQVQLYRRMLFNVIACNRDDHTKNISFIMPQSGKWQLSPAYDVTFSYNPQGKWTSKHQMSIAGKRDGFSHHELLAVGDQLTIPNPDEILENVLTAIDKWPLFADQAGIKPEISNAIAAHFIR